MTLYKLVSSQTTMRSSKNVSWKSKRLDIITSRCSIIRAKPHKWNCPTYQVFRNNEISRGNLRIRNTKRSRKKTEEIRDSMCAGRQKIIVGTSISKSGKRLLQHKTKIRSLTNRIGKMS